MKKGLLSAAAVVAALALTGSPALAQTNEITIGISISTTGPAAALGIPERNALDFVPKEIGGVPIKIIVLDDGGDHVCFVLEPVTGDHPEPVDQLSFQSVRDIDPGHEAGRS